MSHDGNDNYYEAMEAQVRDEGYGDGFKDGIEEGRRVSKMVQIMINQYTKDNLDEIIKDMKGQLIGYPDVVSYLVRVYRLNREHGMMPDNSKGE